MKTEVTQYGGAIERARIQIWATLDDDLMTRALSAQPAADPHPEVRACLLDLVSEAGALSSARLTTLIRRSHRPVPYLDHADSEVQASARLLDRALKKEISSRLTRAAA